MSRTQKQKWSDLSRGRQTAILVSGSVQLALAASAWIDLWRRDPSEVKGSKAMWAAIIGINFVGPIAYFVRGRQNPAAGEAPEPA